METTLPAASLAQTLMSLAPDVPREFTLYLREATMPFFVAADGAPPRFGD